MLVTLHFVTMNVNTPSNMFPTFEILLVLIVGATLAPL